MGCEAPGGEAVMIKDGVRFLFVLTVLASVFLCGCDKRQGSNLPDLVVEVADTRGVQPGSPVMWKGLAIGQVESAEMAPEGVILSVRLKPEFEGKLHSDARARPSAGFSSRGEPVLEIYGGADPNMPLVPVGGEVPEADIESVVAAIPSSTWITLGAVLVVLLLILVIARGLAKFLVFVAALLFLLCSLWFLKSRVQEYEVRLLSPEWEVRFQELAERTIQSPEAVAAWQAIRAEMDVLSDQAKAKGGDAADKLQQQIEELIAREANTLRDAGKEAAAQQIEELRSKSSALLQGSEATEKEEPPVPPNP